MTIQLSDCCKATIDLDKTKERPECYTCSKCGRIIGSPLSTHNTRDGIEEKYDKLVLELMGQSAFSAYVGSFHHAKIKSFIHQELQKARESERELIWLPIQTAPKDGTHILVTNGRLCTVAHYFEGDTGGGWYLSWNEFACSADYQMNTITHWQALTPPTRL